MKIDEHLIRMIQNVTNAEVEVTKQKGRYVITAHNVQADALKRAVEGMAGERFIGMAESKDKLLFTIKYGDCPETFKIEEPLTFYGVKYANETCYALQFISGFEDDLRKFCGSGEIQKGETDVFIFLDPETETFRRVSETDFVINRNGRFEIMAESEFKNKWHKI